MPCTASGRHRQGVALGDDPSGRPSIRNEAPKRCPAGPLELRLGAAAKLHHVHPADPSEVSEHTDGTDPLGVPPGLV